MSRPRMSTWTLGAIMVIVPTSFYLGTALNRHYAITEPSMSVPSEMQAEEVHQVPLKLVSKADAYSLPQMSPSDEMAMIQSRLKSLKTTRMALEMELKDNKDKLRRLEERMKRQEQS